MSTSVFIHCLDCEPREFRVFVRELSDCCTLDLTISDNDVNFFLPISMHARLTRAVDALNAAMARPDDGPRPGSTEAAIAEPQEVEGTA